MSVARHEVGPRMSQAVVHGSTVYLAGQVAQDASQGVTGQTAQILAEIDRLLALAGSHKSKILSAQVFLANMGSFAEMNAAWDAWVDKGNPPARASLETRLAAPQFLVEIMVVAAR